MKEVETKEVETEVASGPSVNLIGNEKKIDVNALIEKGKKGKLSASDLDEALEEMNFDAESLDKLYETLEDNGISFDGDLSNEEMSAIENEVEAFSAAENMERILEQEGHPNSSAAAVWRRSTICRTSSSGWPGAASSITPPSAKATTRPSCKRLSPPIWATTGWISTKEGSP